MYGSMEHVAAVVLSGISLTLIMLLSVLSAFLVHLLSVFALFRRGNELHAMMLRGLGSMFALLSVGISPVWCCRRKKIELKCGVVVVVVLVIFLWP